MTEDRKLQEKISIAPMMECTDQHFRYLMRLISKSVMLYTEMVHTNQILYAGAQRFLHYHQSEHPLVLQLGGSDPKNLAKCAALGEKWGYDAINLNVGCPSQRVQKGSFGACLMKQPLVVAQCLKAMEEIVKIPVTVKTRLGVDEYDNEAFFFDFIETLAKSGCHHFIIHARKAWLKGLNPKQNRSVPPINYARVYKLKQKFPELNIIINGGIKTMEDIQNHLKHVDGVMIGRQAYTDPFLFSQVDERFFAMESSAKSRLAIFKDYITYAQDQLAQGVKLNLLIRPILGLFHGLPGARSWRGFLTTQANHPQQGIDLFQESLSLLQLANIEPSY